MYLCTQATASLRHVVTKMCSPLMVERRLHNQPRIVRCYHNTWLAESADLLSFLFPQHHADCAQFFALGSRSISASQRICEGQAVKSHIHALCAAHSRALNVFHPAAIASPEHQFVLFATYDQAVL